MELNLTLKGDNSNLFDGSRTMQHHSLKISDEGEIQMSKEEMLQIIESQKKEIKYQTQRCKTLTEEKAFLIENFQVSS